MVDKAHRETDKILHSLEASLKDIYTAYYKDAKKSILEIYNKIDFTKNMTPIERYNEALKYGRIDNIQKEFANILAEAGTEAIKNVNNEMYNIYKVNYKHGIDELAVLLSTFIDNAEDVIDYDYNTKTEVREKVTSPFDAIAIDNIKYASELRREIGSQIIKSIMRGDNALQFTKELKKIAELRLYDIVRIARTETTRFENVGRLDAYSSLEDKGFVVYKEWVAVGDNKTRTAHKDANGQQVPLDEPFNVGGEKLMYPGDPNGTAGNVINCRCTMRSGIKRIKNE